MAGATDFHFTPVQMKKGRPGLLLSVLTDSAILDQVCDFLLEQTTSIGLRYYSAQRKTLSRRLYEADTRYGPVQIKEVERPSGLKTRKFEHESLRELSKKHHISIQQLQSELCYLLSQDL